MNIRTLTPEDRVYINVDLYDAGTTEDGTPFTAEVYQVFIERLDGHRIALTSKTWWTAPSEVSPDGFNFFGDLREEMKAEAEAVVNRIEDKGVINLDHWEEVYPAYGSAYYCEVNSI